jgi:hypothetical protein
MKCPAPKTRRNVLRGYPANQPLWFAHHAFALNRRFPCCFSRGSWRVPR